MSEGALSANFQRPEPPLPPGEPVGWRKCYVVGFPHWGGLRGLSPYVCAFAPFRPSVGTERRGGVLMKEFFGPLPSGSTAAFALASRPCAVSGSLRKGPGAVMRVQNVTSYGRLRQLAGRRSNGLRSSLLLVSAPARMKPGSSVAELAPLLCGSTRAVLRHSYFLPLGETVFKERLCK